MDDSDDYSEFLEDQSEYIDFRRNLLYDIHNNINIIDNEPRINNDDTKIYIYSLISMIGISILTIIFII